MWCIPQVDADYVARMEDVLDLYAEAPDPKRPVVCFDESPIQLIGEVRRPIPPKPGQFERYDCEYRRNGNANLFVFVDVNRPWRKVKVTERRAAADFAACSGSCLPTASTRSRRARARRWRSRWRKRRRCPSRTAPRSTSKRTGLAGRAANTPINGPRRSKPGSIRSSVNWRLAASLRIWSLRS
jgi:DDE superfamily endonuclease